MSLPSTCRWISKIWCNLYATAVKILLIDTSLIDTETREVSWCQIDGTGDCRNDKVGVMTNLSFPHSAPFPSYRVAMVTSSNGNIFRVTGLLCGEFTGHRWIPLTKAGDAELWCFLWSAPWINGWINNREAGELRRYHAHYDVIVMRHQVISTWNELYLALSLPYLIWISNILFFILRYCNPRVL